MTAPHVRRGYLLGDSLAHSARLHGRRIALRSPQGSLRYSELYERATRVANALRGSGHATGDRISVLSPNRTEYGEIYFGCALSGVVCAPVNWRLTSTELAAILADARARTLFADRSQEHKVEALRAAGLDIAVHYLGEADYEVWLGSGAATPPDVELNENLPVLEIYTSGTTGRAKGVLLSHRNWIANAEANLAAGSIAVADRYLGVAPLCHATAGSRLFGLVHCGAEHVLMNEFDAGRIAELIRRGEVTATALVPTMLRALVDEFPGSGRVSTLRMITFGAEPLSEELLGVTTERLRCALLHGYGLTEAASALTYLRLGQGAPPRSETQLRSVGQEVLGVDVRVADADGRTVAAGNVGEILARGPKIMLGYANQPEETAQAMRGGWLHTGDLGYVDDTGFLYLSGRLKDLIISGGLNVYAREVEVVLEAHPCVALAAVVGRSDPRWGETPVAYLQLRAGQDEVTTDNVTPVMDAFVVDKLAGFKRPKQWTVLSELPRAASGKIDKQLLRAWSTG
jgi:acyl-CoA synthetase (AMP-forming)/AMP-acid ligase II